MEITVLGNLDHNNLKNNLLEENLAGLKEAARKTLSDAGGDAAIIAKKDGVIYLVVCGAGKIMIEKKGAKTMALESVTGELTGASGKNNNETFVLITPGL